MIVGRRGGRAGDSVLSLVSDLDHADRLGGAAGLDLCHIGRGEPSAACRVNTRSRFGIARDATTWRSRCGNDPRQLGEIATPRSQRRFSERGTHEREHGIAGRKSCRDNVWSRRLTAELGRTFCGVWAHYLRSFQLEICRRTGICNAPGLPRSASSCGPTGRATWMPMGGAG